MRHRGAIALASVALWFFPAHPSASPIVPNGFVDEVVTADLTEPVAFAFLPEGRALVIEHYSAKILLIENQTPSLVAVIPNVEWGGERGLLGIALDPDWPSRPYVYVLYNAAVPPSIKISRFTASGNLDGSGFGPLQIDLDSRYDILADIPDQVHVHNGGTLRFGKDRMLYVSLGDDDAICDAQDLTRLNGSILRLDVFGLPEGPGGPPDKANITPADNPFAGSSDENARLIWAYGLRNPFRFTIDTKTGDVFIGDVGAVTHEEINVADRGGLNFGWPWIEGTTPWRTCSSGPGTFTDPSFGYDHPATGPTAIIPAVLYRRTDPSTSFPEGYEGDFFYCDYYSGDLVRMTRERYGWAMAPPVSGQPSASAWATGIRRATDFQLSPDGSIWYIAHYGGQLRRISFTHNAVDVPLVTRRVLPTPLYYDIQGRRVDQPGPSGVYFVREGRGEPAKRVILK